MGLDVLLYTREQADRNRVYNDAWEDLFTEGSDGKSKRDAMSDEEFKAWQELTGSYSTADDVPSERYPDHLFNRRYLRSSYNGAGFNRAVPDFLGQPWGLNWIFQSVILDDQYEMELTSASIDALRDAKSRALEVAEALRSSDRLRVKTVGPNIFSGVQPIDDDKALEMYREAVAEGRITPDSWWSNRDMEVFGDGMTLLAAIAGKGTFGEPAVHLVYRAGDEAIDSYVQSAEITAEFCDEAISLIDRDGSCLMVWSG